MSIHLPFLKLCWQLGKRLLAVKSCMMASFTMPSIILEGIEVRLIGLQVAYYDSSNLWGLYWYSKMSERS